ncbi:ACT domain-containing protein [Cypionkella sp. TWP1-2-1b2]|uniref:ACT domain-containing protein n=1 Tax=Cypionkella sp. TWP1-2-1b2 TaxID=2804675 RepID=UPI003CEB98F4
MAGEADLAVLLRSMQPELHGSAYTYAATDTAVVGAFAQVAESERMTVIATVEVLQAHWIVVEPASARISLSVHSDLAAVGLTAAIAQTLAATGISANVVAGFCHDHVFVPWEQRLQAIAALRVLSDV